MAANIPRASEAEAWVGERINWDSGTGVDSVLAQEFGQRMAAESSPIDDHRSTAAYRRHAVGVLAARALQRVFSEGTNGYV